MSVKIASMYAEISVNTQKFVDGMKNVKQGLSSTESNLKNTANEFVSMGIKAIGAATLVKKGFEFIKDSAMVAARVEEMGIVLEVLGKQAGMTKGQIEKQTAAIKSMGVETGVAQNVMAQFIRYNLDMAKSTDLARVAQDAAVIASQNSSEALDGLIYGITTFNPKILRTYGIIVDSTQAFSEYAATLGKSADELSGTEKQQAYLNAVIESGSSIAGAYDAAMGSAFKKIGSYERVVNDLKIAVGQGLTPALNDGIDVLTKWTKQLTVTFDTMPKMNNAFDAMIKRAVDGSGSFEEYEKTMRNFYKSLSFGEEFILSLTSDLSLMTEEEYNAMKANMPQYLEMLSRAAYDAEHGTRGAAGAASDFSDELDEQANAINTAIGAMKDYSQISSTLISGAQMLDDQNRKLAEAEKELNDTRANYIAWGPARIEQINTELEKISELEDTEENLAEKTKLQNELSVLSTKGWQENSGAIVELKDKVELLKEANELQTKQWVANIVLQQLSLGPEGLSGAEMEYYLNYMVHAGLMTQESSEMAESLYNDGIKIGNALTYQAIAADKMANSLRNIPRNVNVDIDIKENYYRGRDKGATYGGFASGGSFKGWAMVGDSSGGGITPFTEWVYAPHGAVVYNQSQMAGRSAPSMAGGGVISKVEDPFSGYSGPTAYDIGEAVGNKLMQLGVI